MLLAETASGRVCPLEGRYDAVAPTNSVAPCYSYLNIGCDVTSIIDVIDTCSGTPGAILIYVIIFVSRLSRSAAEVVSKQN